MGVAGVKVNLLNANNQVVATFTTNASGNYLFDKLAAGSDIVLEVLYPTPRRTVKTVNDLQSVLSGLKDGDYVSLLVQNMDPRVGQRVVNIRVGG